MFKFENVDDVIAIVEFCVEQARIIDFVEYTYEVNEVSLWGSAYIIFTCNGVMIRIDFFDTTASVVYDYAAKDKHMLTAEDKRSLCGCVSAAINYKEKSMNMQEAINALGEYGYRPKRKVNGKLTLEDKCGYRMYLSKKDGNVLLNERLFKHPSDIDFEIDRRPF